MGRAIKYIVRLTSDERKMLFELIDKGRASKEKLNRTRILLKADCGEEGANWGDGFATDPSLINGMSNPASFFNTLLTKPYLNQVVISPHVYPPSVTGATIPVTPPANEDVTVTVEIGSPWQDNPGSGIYTNSINFYVKNNGTSAISSPWDVTIVNSSYKSVPSFWNVVVSSTSNGKITGKVKEGWQSLPAKSTNSVNFEMIVSSTSTNFAPTSILINGKPATIIIK